MTHKTYVRICIPDSHGSAIDKPAASAFLADLARLGDNVKEIVWLGDHIDAAGQFSGFEVGSLEERSYDYEADGAATNELLDHVQALAPKAKNYYLGGNHEDHLERWAARNISGRLASKFVKQYGPEGLLGLEKRGIEYFAWNGFHHGLTFRNTIRLGRCYFTHGWKIGPNATRQMLLALGHSFVHGHTHRACEVRLRTIDNSAILGACPGTLASLQPSYMKTTPTEWTHGYGLQFVDEKTGYFQHVNVSIINGKSMFAPQIERIYG